jgi:hypothetical protein
MGGDAQPVRSFPCGTPELGKVSVLEMSKPAVHNLQAVRRGGRAEIRLLDQRGLQAPHGAIPGHAGAEDPTTQYHDVKASVGKFLHEPYHCACSLRVDEDRRDATCAPAFEDCRC